MRVKIGDKWYDSELEPVCIQVNETEQKQIGEMDRRAAPAGKYAVFPGASGMSAKEMSEWMKG